MTGPGADRDLPRIARITNSLLPPRLRFDYWRSLNFLVDLDVPDRELRHGYRAELVRYLAADGVEFGFGSSDDTISRFSKPSGDFIMLSMALSGKVGVRHDGGEHTVTPASGFSVVDGARPLTTVTVDHSHLYLVIPRAKLQGRFDNDLSLPDKGFCSLPRHALAYLLEAHLQAMASMGPTLDPTTAKIAMKAAVDLAVGSLAQAATDGGPLDPERQADALFAAACRYIRVNAGRYDLTAADVAAAVGCSRAGLFRIFETHDETIRGTIENVRFEWAAVLLSSDTPPPIEQVAMLCGFSGAAVFARSFRRRFGTTPTAFRESRHLAP
jgi:AraC family transcriptional regulator, positive regulator of tynA and feaB